MKKLLIILLAATLCSCATTKYAAITRASLIDYSEYTKNGFFITESNTLNKEYAPVASLQVECRSGYELITPAQTRTDNSGTVWTVKAAKYGEYKQATPESAVAAFVSLAKESGANGIINLEITVLTPNTGKLDGGFLVSGMAIKIK